MTDKDIISKSKITAFILGGDAGTAVQAIDSYDNLISFIKDGGNYSKDSPGAPIAYKLNYLKDNSPARMSETTNYDVQTCDRVSQKVQVILDNISVDSADDSGDDLEIYGDICRFLGVTPHFVPDMRQKHLKATGPTRALAIDPADRSLLVDLYRDDIAALANLVNRNLDHWLRYNPS